VRDGGVQVFDGDAVIVQRKKTLANKRYVSLTVYCPAPFLFLMDHMWPHRNSFVDERFANTLSALTESAKVRLAGGIRSMQGVLKPKRRTSVAPIAAPTLGQLQQEISALAVGSAAGSALFPHQTSAASSSLLFPEHGVVGSGAPSRRSSVGSMTYSSAPSRRSSVGSMAYSSASGSHNASPNRGEGADMLSPFVSPREHGRRDANRRYSVQADGAAGEPFNPALVAHALNKVKLEAWQVSGTSHGRGHPAASGRTADDVLLFTAPEGGVGHAGLHAGAAGAGAGRKRRRSAAVATPLPLESSLSPAPHAKAYLPGVRRGSVLY
jgi:hypothetical protein